MEKYKELHAYLELFTGQHQLTYHLSDGAITILSQKYSLSRADVIAGIIRFCNRTGMAFYFTRNAFGNE